MTTELDFEMLQGSAEWLEWRRQGVGSSDVPPLMGELEYSTPLKVFRIKRGLDQEQVSTFVMQRGTESEPRIRALYELQYGYDCPPATIEHAEHSYLRASLDGWNPDLGLVVEFKYPGKEKHALAVNGQVPSCYRDQVLYQIAVTGALKGHYVSFDGESIAVVEVLRDEERIALILQTVKSFWERVLNNEPPPLTDQDFLTLEHPGDMKLFGEWKSARLIQMQYEDLLSEAKKVEPSEVISLLKEKARSADAHLEVCRSHVLKRGIHPKILCAGVQMIRMKRKSGETWDIRVKESA